VQSVLAVAQVFGLLLVSAIGLAFSFASTSVAPIDPATYGSIQASAIAQGLPTVSTNVGLMMVFVLLSYGGWNEAAYISAEVQNLRRNLVLARCLH
jgi:basic amino acid/polyamine antiporter, APA family